MRAAKRRADIVHARALAIVGLLITVAGCSPSIGESPDTSRPSPTAVASAVVIPSSVEPSPSASLQPMLGSVPIGPTETAAVLRVIDGDTIEVDRGHGPEKLRYIGIDAPESVDPNSPVEFMAQEASKANAKLVDGQTVVLELDVSETDRFGRLLRYVWLKDESSPSGWLFVNEALVSQGFAQAVAYPPDVRFAGVFSGAQDAAMAAGVGLWAVAPSPEPSPAAVEPSSTVAAGCHPSYSPCLPIVNDLDCADVRALGAAPVKVTGPDEYRLDRDNDGRGCE